MMSSRHLILNYNDWSNSQISEKIIILTSPKLCDFHKKLRNLLQRPFWHQKNSYFVLGYDYDVCYNQISSLLEAG